MFVRVAMSALIFTIALFALVLPESHAETRNSHIKFENGWIRVTSSDHPMTAGYITISNNGSKDFVLMSVSSAFAKMVELHETTFHNNVMKMRELKNGIKIPANGTIHLKPKGRHLMFKGLKTTIMEAEKYKVKFIFINGSGVEVTMLGKRLRTEATAGKHKH